MDNKKRHDTQVAPSNQEHYKRYLRKLSSGTQNHRVLKYIMEHGSITTYEAFEKLRITRLPARISDIKAIGCPIYKETIVKKDGTHYSKYFMGEEK